MGASYSQVIRHVVLPSALPEILAGMSTDIVMVCIIVIGIVAHGFDLLARWVERRVIPWKGTLCLRKLSCILSAEAGR